MAAYQYLETRSSAPTSTFWAAGLSGPSTHATHLLPRASKGVPMNPRQRRGVLLILVTVLGAIVTFIAVFNYVQSVSSQVGPKTTVLELSKDVNELQGVTAADVTATQVPERWAPKNAVHDLSEVQGKVTASSYSKGAVLQTSMLQDPPQLTEGYREVTIMVDAETGVAGKVASGSRVDVVSTLQDPNNKQQTAQVIIQNALITDVGVATKVEDESDSGDFKESEAVPVTFALTPDESLKLAYAESFSKKVRLMLRREGDNSSISNPEYSTTGSSTTDGGNH
ncbi:MAG: Flp pilus assembly protein CpaB [Actinomyces massiliensis]|jgi:flp pilus assembly protein cpaB